MQRIIKSRLVRRQPVRFRVQPGAHDRRSPHDHVIAVAAISILPRQILSGYRGVLVAGARSCAPVPRFLGGWDWPANGLVSRTSRMQMKRAPN